jgi:hypothetical protein
MNINECFAPIIPKCKKCMADYLIHLEDEFAIFLDLFWIYF